MQTKRPASQSCAAKAKARPDPRHRVPKMRQIGLLLALASCQAAALRVRVRLLATSADPHATVSSWIASANGGLGVASAKMGAATCLHGKMQSTSVRPADPVCTCPRFNGLCYFEGLGQARATPQMPQVPAVVQPGRLLGTVSCAALTDCTACTGSSSLCAWCGGQCLDFFSELGVPTCGGAIVTESCKCSPTLAPTATPTTSPTATPTTAPTASPSRHYNQSAPIAQS